MTTAAEQARLDAKIMKHARSGLPCIRCSRQDGTVCGRHYNGIRQHWFGKGRGIKAHPFTVADFCNACDEEFTEGAVPKNDLELRTDYSERFLFYCLMTLIRRAEMGVL